MIIFDVLTNDSPVGWKGERTRLFLSDTGYEKALDSQAKGQIKILSITIIGIPVGLQCFKFATLAFWPFGKEIVYGNGMFSFLVNLIWIVFFGWEMALGNLIVGCIWCITIVGIPFGKQFFKMARLSFMPFGASVIG